MRFASQNIRSFLKKVMEIAVFRFRGTAVVVPDVIDRAFIGAAVEDDPSSDGSVTPLGPHKSPVVIIVQLISIRPDVVVVAHRFQRVHEMAATHSSLFEFTIGR